MPPRSLDKLRHSRPLGAVRAGALATGLAPLALAAGFALASVAAPAPAHAQGGEAVPPISVPNLPLPTAPTPPNSPQTAPQPAQGTYDQVDGLAGTWSYDRGLYVHYCPAARSATARAVARVSGRRAATAASGPRASASHTSWAGWPAKQCLKMDKGPAGESHTIVGLDGVHNWLLGGYGNDTIIGGDRGDVIWGDYHPTGAQTQVATIYAGNGRNVIYANDTRNFVWTGTNPRTVVHAHGPGTSGEIHCQSPEIVVYLSSISQRHFKLDGCRHISHYSVGY